MSNVLQSYKKHYKVIFILHCVICTSSSEAQQMKRSTHHSHLKINDMKYILLWKAKGDFKRIFGEGPEMFTRNCPINNCFITSDKYKFGGDLKKFDAILFNGWNQKWLKRGILPNKRYYHQIYAFVQRESAAKAYVCHKGFDDFFNWTITYKLDSDIVFPHIHVRDINNDIVGPKDDMHWFNDMMEIDETFAKSLENKTKGVAWMYTNCIPTKINRIFVDRLERALNKYGFEIDIYGKCGPLQCNHNECDQMLNKDYYFYLALEDSFAEDYVSGNILRALRGNVVPVVYGGAKYSKFLPPESYLDGTSHTPESLAAIINSLVKNQTLYKRYFRWKSHFSFCLGLASPKLPWEGLSYCSKTICDLCEALNDPNRFKVHSAYKDFRKWWYPDYVDKCGNQGSANSSPNTHKQIEEEKLKKEELENKIKVFGNESKIDKKRNINRENRKINKKESRKSKTKTSKENKTRSNKVKNNDNSMEEEKEGKRGPFSVLKRSGDEDLIRKFADLIELRRTATMQKSFIVPGGSHGGGGGGLSRTAGMVAIELSRCRATALSNNFDITKR